MEAIQVVLHFLVAMLKRVKTKTFNFFKQYVSLNPVYLKYFHFGMEYLKNKDISVFSLV